MLSAYAIVYFRFPFRMACFWTIFLTLMLPVEVRIMPTFKVVADLGLLELVRRPDDPADRVGHRHLPVPAVLPDRARGADRGRPDRRGRPAAVLLVHPRSRCRRTNIAALFVILFIFGWNQYLWPLLVTTDERCRPSSWASSGWSRRATRRRNGTWSWRRSSWRCCPRGDVVVHAALVHQGPDRDREVKRGRMRWLGARRHGAGRCWRRAARRPEHTEATEEQEVPRPEWRVGDRWAFQRTASPA